MENMCSHIFTISTTGHAIPVSTCVSYCPKTQLNCQHSANHHKAWPFLLFLEIFAPALFRGKGLMSTEQYGLLNEVLLWHCHTGQDVDIHNGLHLELQTLANHHFNFLIFNARKPQRQYIYIYLYASVHVCIYTHMPSKGFDCFCYQYLFLVIAGVPERKVYMSQPLLPLRVESCCKGPTEWFRRGG